MSEELIVPGEQQSSTMAVQADDKQTTTPDVDPYESEAREQGWKPKEEYEGDPEKWRPAKEFVERGELFGKIMQIYSIVESELNLVFAF